MSNCRNCEAIIMNYGQEFCTVDCATVFVVNAEQERDAFRNQCAVECEAKHKALERVRELDGELITSRRYWEKQCVSLVDRVRELEEVLRSCCNVLEANNFKGPGGAYDRAIQVLMEEADGEECENDM